MDIKNFWNKLVKELDYRFFTGIPHPGLSELYALMDPEYMHYIPVNSYFTAVGLAAGVAVSGTKPVILCDSSMLLTAVTQIDAFLLNCNIPALFISTEDVNMPGVVTFYLEESTLDEVDLYITTASQPAVLVIPEG